MSLTYSLSSLILLPPWSANKHYFHATNFKTTLCRRQNLNPKSLIFSYYKKNYIHIYTSVHSWYETEASKTKTEFATPTAELLNGKCRKFHFTVFFRSFWFKHKIPPMHFSGRNKVSKSSCHYRLHTSSNKYKTAQTIVLWLEQQEFKMKCAMWYSFLSNTRLFVLPELRRFSINFNRDKFPLNTDTLTHYYRWIKMFFYP